MVVGDLLARTCSVSPLYFKILIDNNDWIYFYREEKGNVALKVMSIQ